MLETVGAFLVPTHYKKIKTDASNLRIEMLLHSDWIISTEFVSSCEMTSTVQITRMDRNKSLATNDELAVEEPLQIQGLYGSSGKEQTKNIAVTMRTPGNDAELVAGFLFTEGIVKHKSELISIIPEASGANTTLAVFNGRNTIELVTDERSFYINSSCGVCGKSSIDVLRRQPTYPVPDTDFRIKALNLYQMPILLKREQRLFRATGGLHASAFFDLHGQLIMLREDVGRHNALDKIIGAMMLADEVPILNRVLLLSGRVSFEMVQKAAMAGIQIIAAIGAPSSLAVELALQCQITLVGFLNEDRFNVYSHSERIDESEKAS